MPEKVHSFLEPLLVGLKIGQLPLDRPVDDCVVEPKLPLAVDVRELMRMYPVEHERVERVLAFAGLEDAGAEVVVLARSECLVVRQREPLQDIRRNITLECAKGDLSNAVHRTASGSPGTVRSPRGMPSRR